MVCAFMISTPHAHCLFAARVGTPGSWHSEWSERWGVGNILVWSERSLGAPTVRARRRRKCPEPWSGDAQVVIALLVGS